MGADCSDFTSFLWNFAFGAYLDTAIGSQACNPAEPGVIIPYTSSQLNMFQPGDLLYIAPWNSSLGIPNTVTHVVSWTGYTMGETIIVNGTSITLSREFLMNNTAWGFEYTMANTGIDAAIKANQPIYIIVDSHNAGPNYRPFTGWYTQNFSHARRLINAPTTSTYPANIQPSFNSSAYSCTVTRTSKKLRKNKLKK